VASSFHGIARSTIDADLVASIPASKVTALVELLSPDYYVDADMILDAIRRQASFNVIHNDTAIKIDVYVLKRRPFDLESFARRKTGTLDDRPGAREFSFEMPEDVILHKLEWYRLGGEVADRQWTDVLGVLKVQQAALDIGYLRRWARELHVQDLLERAFVDAGLEPES
jgi:hypothetical protein